MALNGRIVVEGVPSTGTPSTSRPCCGAVATTVRPEARSTPRRGIADRHEAATAMGQRVCRRIVASGKDEGRRRWVEREAEPAQAVGEGGGEGIALGTQCHRTGQGDFAWRRSATAPGDPRLQIAVDGEPEGAPQRDRLDPRLELLARRIGAGDEIAAGAHLGDAVAHGGGAQDRADPGRAVAPHLDHQAAVPAARPGLVGGDRGQRRGPRRAVTITGAAVAAIASQASASSRKRPRRWSTAWTTVASVIGRRRAPGGASGHAERREVVAQGVGADRERGGVDLLVEQVAQRLGLADRPWPRATVPQTGKASTSRPAMSSCRSGDAPNTTSPSPLSRKKVAGAGFTSRRREKASAGVGRPRRRRKLCSR
jgi:hypothetical protein